MFICYISSAFKKLTEERKVEKITVGKNYRRRKDGKVLDIKLYTNDYKQKSCSNVIIEKPEKTSTRPKRQSTTPIILYLVLVGTGVKELNFQPVGFPI